MNVTRVLGVALVAVALSTLLQANDLSAYHQIRFRVGVVAGSAVGLGLIWFAERLSVLFEIERQLIPASVIKSFGFCALGLTITGAYIRLRFFG